MHILRLIFLLHETEGLVFMRTQERVNGCYNAAQDKAASYGAVSSSPPLKMVSRANFEESGPTFALETAH